AWSFVVNLTDQMDDSDKPTEVCFTRAPAGTLRCEMADALSCFMVNGLEELISRVIWINTKDTHSFHFPITLAVPFYVHHRSSHREVAVKMVDKEKRVSYISPVTTDAAHGGQKGCFAEVKVYSLGIFAVVSRLKSEMYIVPKKGLSLKLPMDPRICLNYSPGSFTVPIMAQTMVQPVDAILLAAIKSRNDAYELVVSVSPLLHLTHPKTQPLRRPLTIILPFAFFLYLSGRILRAYVKTNERTREFLTVLGSRDKEWSVLDKTVVRNQQDGLVSFILYESFDRFVNKYVYYLLYYYYLNFLLSFLSLFKSRLHSVTIVLRCGRDDPHSVLLAALPSRDLSWELSRLRAQGWDGLIETSSEVLLCEGDQLLLHFSGNITSAGVTSGRDPHERLTFHYQRRNELFVRLREVDPFGNYSSPCYKGTALLYRVSRAELEWRGDKAVLKDAELLGNPVCKLPLSLPKKVRLIHRPISTRVKTCEEAEPLSDSLLLWLSGELTQEETARLVSSLHLSRSSAQLAKLRFRDSPSDQAFHILAMWRRALPAAKCHPKTSQLAQSLTKIGRPDLAQEMIMYWPGVVFHSCDICFFLSYVFLVGK
uniref:Death domain containing 1 n=1 Tax=Cyprinodon variegatus TaxID=28743 RepID=A0A3Q2CV63_CYPVA